MCLSWWDPIDQGCFVSVLDEKGSYPTIIQWEFEKQIRIYCKTGWELQPILIYEINDPKCFLL